MYKLKRFTDYRGKMAKVSIIVPFYNTEKYIEKCLKSLIGQTLSDIEIICINDGSKDNSVNIVKQYAKDNKRIKLIEQENLKQGAARNNGTKIASGEYIGYVDSDDWVDSDYFEKLYKTAIKYDSDIALATNVRIGNGKTKKRLEIAEEKLAISLQEKFDVCSLAKNPCPTNKIYRASFLKDNNITWPEGCYCEDKLFVTQAVYYANSVVAVPKIQYYYFRNPHSTVNSKSKKHLKQLIKDKNNAKLAVLNFLKEKKAEIRDKEFWAITKEVKFLNIPIFAIKESLHTKRILLFSIIPIGEYQC